MILIHSFINNENWTNITSGGNEPTKRIQTNDILIFNLLELTWSLNATNASKDIFAYCAIILPDETILYIGGAHFKDTGNREILPLNSYLTITIVNKTDIYIYVRIQPVNSSWSPPFLNTSDKRIIIFGGVDDHVLVLGDLWILDIESYQWLAGNISLWTY
ncbi:galactose oxidase [Gigaspora margarita]|uniref:Galactose oxidase n=1 Tax=Gigaspora margarita TaxID=4874 RepID=A0A8H4ANW0_GIGMA|nr:galactose oxidase [Gigaspora margarita]